METITSAEAKHRLTELLARVAAGERFLIQRREHPLAVLIDAEELARLERNARLVHRLAVVLEQDEQLLEAIGQGSVHPAMAVFGLWRDDPAMDDLAERLADQRIDQPSRAVPEL